MTILSTSYFYLLLACTDKTNTEDTGTLDTGTIDTGTIDTGSDSGDIDTAEDTGEIEPAPPPYPNSVLVLELSETLENAADFAFLASIPATSHSNSGLPAVLASEDLTDLSPATEDLLERLNPDHAFVLVDSINISQAENTHTLSFENPSQFSLELLETFWVTAETVVFASEEDYAGSILASSLAALLNAPLLYVDQLSEEDIQNAISSMDTQTILSVSLTGTPLDLSVEHESLVGLSDVLTWLSSIGKTPNYLALTNPEDRFSGRSQKSSLVASIFAARREGLSIPFSLSMPTQVIASGEEHPAVEYMNSIYEIMGQHPEYLAIVGAHDALPQTRNASIFNNPVNEHPVSDLPYGEIDSDPFLDISIGRIVGDTLSEMSNLATRSAHYEQLLDNNWEYQFIESGLWGFDELRDLMQNVGYEDPEHLSQQEINAQNTLEVGAILHKDHSYCQVLGHAFDLQTQTLFAPAIVLSRGCSVGGIDLLPTDQRSIVDHMLGLGAVAFVGASRNSIAQNTLIEISMWNQILSGQSIGHAFRYGINDAIVHWQDENSSALRYSLDIEILYGDPALEIYIPESPISSPASSTYNSTELIVTPPQDWNLIAFHPEQLSEWNYSGNLFMYSGAGASPKTYWSGSHDSEDLYFGVQLPLETPPNIIQQDSTHNAPLGWTGQFYIDTHQNGSATALWRVRLLDYDPYTGDITGADPEFRYTITY